MATKGGGTGAAEGGIDSVQEIDKSGDLRRARAEEAARIKRGRAGQRRWDIAQEGLSRLRLAASFLSPRSESGIGIVLGECDDEDLLEERQVPHAKVLPSPEANEKFVRTWLARLVAAADAVNQALEPGWAASVPANSLIEQRVREHLVPYLEPGGQGSDPSGAIGPLMELRVGLKSRRYLIHDWTLRLYQHVAAMLREAQREALARRGAGPTESRGSGARGDLAGEVEHGSTREQSVSAGPDVSPELASPGVDAAPTLDMIAAARKSLAKYAADHEFSDVEVIVIYGLTMTASEFRNCDRLVCRSGRKRRPEQLPHSFTGVRPKDDRGKFLPARWTWTLEEVATALTGWEEKLRRQAGLPPIPDPF